jgi:hypothetical protein
MTPIQHIFNFCFHFATLNEITRRHQTASDKLHSKCDHFDQLQIVVQIRTSQALSVQNEKDRTAILEFLKIDSECRFSQVPPPMKDGTRSRIVKRKAKELNRNGTQGIQHTSIVSWI